MPPADASIISAMSKHGAQCRTETSKDDSNKLTAWQISGTNK